MNNEKKIQSIREGYSPKAGYTPKKGQESTTTNNYKPVGGEQGAK